MSYSKLPNSKIQANKIYIINIFETQNNKNEHHKINTLKINKKNEKDKRQKRTEPKTKEFT